MKWKHLTLEERNTIELRLKERETFKGIGRELCKDPNVVEKEKTPPEYWDYVREQDEKAKQKPSDYDILQK